MNNSLSHLGINGHAGTAIEIYSIYWLINNFKWRFCRKFFCSILNYPKGVERPHFMVAWHFLFNYKNKLRFSEVRIYIRNGKNLQFLVHTFSSKLWHSQKVLDFIAKFWYLFLFGIELGQYWRFLCFCTFFAIFVIISNICLLALILI